MISKSYLIEQNKEFFGKNKSILFYGENVGLKNDLRRNIIDYFKVKVIKRNQEEIKKKMKN